MHWAFSMCPKWTPPRLQWTLLTRCCRLLSFSQWRSASFFYNCISEKENPKKMWIRNQKINGTFIITSLETEIWVFSTKTHKNWRRQQQHNSPVTRETPAACDLYKLLQLKRTCRNAAPFLSRTPQSCSATWQSIMGTNYKQQANNVCVTGPAINRPFTHR